LDESAAIANGTSAGLFAVAALSSNLRAKRAPPEIVLAERFESRSPYVSVLSVPPL
jgi:hypothetical protein